MWLVVTVGVRVRGASAPDFSGPFFHAVERKWFMESALRIFAQGALRIVLLVNHFRETQTSNNTPYVRRVPNALLHKLLGGA